MKRNLSEELKRIHTLTYGKEVIQEQKFLDRILSGIGLKKAEKKVDDPKKADLVTKDVEDFYSTLQKAVESGGLSQQQRGSMEFQKGVESMQIGLILLGYQLPKHGVDGLFGPETASAVSKFITDNLSGEKKLNEATLDSPIGQTSVNSPFGPRWGRMHHGVDLKVTAKDANGAELGINADFGYDESDDDIFDATLGFGIELDDYGRVGFDVVSVEPRVGADGKVMIGYVVPDVSDSVGTVFPIDVTLSDWDANYDGTAALADLKKTVTYTVGSSTAKVYSAKKSWSQARTRLVLTVAWGAVCSNSIVLFDIEKGNGDMIAAPIRRRANAEGTASLVLQKRRTVNYVTAISCEALGDIEVGPVRARFK